MESVHKIEKTVADWYKNMPHLPATGQKWLADNIWWLTLVALVLSVLAVFPLVGALLLAGAVVGGMGAAYGGAAGAALTGTLILAAWVAIAFLILDVVLLGMAISPLKLHKKKGWDLLFILALINVASVVISGLISFNTMSIIWGLLWSAVGAYFLFEIRERFEGNEKPAHKATKKHDKKATKAE